MMVRVDKGKVEPNKCAKNIFFACHWKVTISQPIFVMKEIYVEIIKAWFGNQNTKRNMLFGSKGV